MRTSKGSSSLALFIVLNLLFFALVSSCGTCPNPPKPKPKPKPIPKAIPCPPPPAPPSCPRDALKLGACGDLLGGLVGAVIGTPPNKGPCCTLLDGLADVEAAACLCTAIKANILGINLNVPVSLSLLLNVCGKKSPPGFKCA